MLFCPTCANLLLTEKTATDFRFYCKTCPYIYAVEEKLNVKMKLDRKEIDDVLGGKEAWENVDRTDVQQCVNNKCSSKRAFFMQIQTRSADEPMTVFYRCVECHVQWKEY
uniref:DNA-directed RNA polymerase subunit n=1 Tax=Strombidium inclinatum TaxID=197538 RepID=A0A7S3IJY3_9SPIT|mmetsp:Transcript_21413/g.33108  ORF Transcript_21413/g.33108 Transcript_21413/m.33108 type:complete len:110 (+) Transcript_21413:28-357(+)